MLYKVNQKGASCYTISQIRNVIMYFKSNILKKQKKIGKNNTYAKYIFIFADINFQKKKLQCQ